MDMIDEKQFVGLLNEIVIFNHNYKRDHTNKKSLKHKRLCEVISHHLCEHLWDIIDFFDMNAKESIRSELKSAIGKIIHESSIDEEELLVDLTKNQEDRIINIVDNLVLENTHEFRTKHELENKNHFTEFFKNMILELREPYQEGVLKYIKDRNTNK